MIRPTIAQIAALDNRIEDVLRNVKGPMRLGEIAKMSRIAEMAAYHQVVTALRRLHKTQRITITGVPPNQMYAIAPGSERMTPVASEPRLGDRVWALWFDKLVYGEFISVKEFVGGGKIYEVRPARSATVEVERIALDGCRLIREIEQEE